MNKIGLTHEKNATGGQFSIPGGGETYHLQHEGIFYENTLNSISAKVSQYLSSIYLTVKDIENMCTQQISQTIEKKKTMTL